MPNVAVEISTIAGLLTHAANLAAYAVYRAKELDPAHAKEYFSAVEDIRKARGKLEIMHLALVGKKAISDQAAKFREAK